MIPDQAQRQQALDPNKSFIIQAPAGSGKTELLTQRLLMLLGRVQQPEEILAITFTRKAASEMRHRIINALIRALNDVEPTSEHEQQTQALAKKVIIRDEQLQWQLLQNPNRLKIQTIDAFCASLTLAMPLLSHFGSQPNITEDAEAFYQQAAENTLQLLDDDQWGPAIATVLQHCDNQLQRLRQLLVELLSSREQWLPYLLQQDATRLRQQLEQSFQQIICHKFNEVKIFVPTLQALLPYLAFAQQHLAAESSLQSLATRALPPLVPENVQGWQTLVRWLLTMTGEFRRQVDKRVGFPAPTSAKDPSSKNYYKQMKKEFVAWLNHCREVPGLNQALNEILLLPQSEFEESQWQVLAALTQILPLLVAQLSLVFQQHASIDFTQVSQAALTALGHEEEPTDLVLALDYRIQHILVDEFQDTSLAQQRLLEKLTMGWQPDDGRTLFLVGDPMQSIYRFRQAEVGIFLQVQQQGLGQVSLTPLRLQANFRSTPSIVNWINSHFPEVFPPKNNIDDGAITYAPSIAMQAENDHSQVQCHALSSDSDESDYLADLIQQCQQYFPDDTIAILVRARRHAAKIINALQYHNIPYQAVDIEYLVESPVINDLFSLTKALVHLNDRIAWLSILRAPWAGLSLHDLTALTQEDDEQFIWQQCLDYKICTGLSATAEQVLARIVPILQQAISQRYRWPLRQWVEATWTALGGPACIDAALDNQVKAYFDLLEQYDLATLDVHALEQQLQYLFAPPRAEQAQGVKIMTIHKAKGLEFDYVFIPGLEQRAPPNRRSLLDWIELTSEDKAHLLMAPIKSMETDEDPMSDFIRHQQQIKDRYEMGRLLYVAATRAKKQLHFLLTPSVDAEGEVRKPGQGTLLHQLWPALEPYCQSLIHWPSRLPAIVDGHEISRLPGSWQLPSTVQWQLPLEPVSLNRQQNQFQWQSPQYRSLGTMLHKALELLLQDATLPDWRVWLQYQGYPVALIPGALEQLEKLLSTVKEDERGRWLLQRHEDSQVEYAIAGRLGDKIVQGVIDRTFIDEEGTRWIVDYKFPQEMLQDLGEFLAFQRQQYTMQLETYAQLMMLGESRPIKLGLYFPLIPAWVEWDYVMSL